MTPGHPEELWPRSVSVTQHKHESRAVSNGNTKLPKWAREASTNWTRSQSGHYSAPRGARIAVEAGAGDVDGIRVGGLRKSRFMRPARIHNNPATPGIAHGGDPRSPCVLVGRHRRRLKSRWHAPPYHSLRRLRGKRALNTSGRQADAVSCATFCAKPSRRLSRQLSGRICTCVHFPVRFRLVSLMKEGRRGFRSDAASLVGWVRSQ